MILMATFGKSFHLIHFVICVAMLFFFLSLLSSDNCPTVENEDQADRDGDEVGDAWYVKHIKSQCAVDKYVAHCLALSPFFK